MLRKTIYLPTFYQTVHFSDATSLTREYDSYYMTHVYELYEMDLVERNIDKHFLRNFAVKSTCLALTYR